VYRVVTPFYSFLYFFLKKINKVREDQISPATLVTLLIYPGMGGHPLIFVLI